MKLIFVLLICFCCTTGLMAQKNHVFIPYDTTADWIFNEAKPAKLSNAEQVELELLVNEVVKAYATELRPWRTYKRQYVVVIKRNGEKVVWVNCFCGKKWDDRTRSEPLLVLDGGNCFFNFKVNLDQGTYYDFMINGEA